MDKRSKYSNRIRVVDDLLKDIVVRDKCLKFLSSYSDLKRELLFDLNTPEEKDVIFLLEYLGLLTTKEVVRDFLPQEIFIKFNPEKVVEFTDTASGKKSIIKKRALEFIARQIGELDSGIKLAKFLWELGVPNCLAVYPNTKWRMVYDALLFYASSPSPEDREMLKKIMEEFCHPLMYRGDADLTQATVNQFNDYLRYDNINIAWDKKENKYTLYLPSENKKEAEKSGVDSDTNYKESLFLVRTFYTKILEILDAFAGGYVTTRNTALNHFYTVLNSLVDDLLKQKEFEELARQKPELFESLIGNIGDFDIEWEFGSQVAYDFLGKIEKLYILSGSPVLDMPAEMNLYLRGADQAIKDHKKLCNEHWHKLEQNADNYKKQLGNVDKVAEQEKSQVKNSKSDSGDKILEAINGALLRGFESMFTGNAVQQTDVVNKIEITSMPPLEIKTPKEPIKAVRNTKTAICLNQFGDLYREPRNKYCYEMGEKDDRHKIIRYLITNKGYQPTSQIALELSKGEDSIIDAIGKFNSIAKGKLNIKENLMLGKKGSGYRINPAYNFSLKNE
jgi:hypothetical protein